MAETTGYAAAIDTGDLIMSYGAEVAWGVLPAVRFQQIRLDGEGFTSSKARQRPNEIDSSGQASAAITTKNESPGSLDFSVSAGTHNDLVASSIGGAWGTAINITASTIAVTGNNTITDSGNGFGSIVPGQWIKMSGFTGAGATANAGFFQVQTAAAGSLTVLPATLIADAAGEPVTIKGQMVRNGSLFNSFYFQKQMASNLFLRYPGAWPTGGDLSVGVGDYLKGKLSFLNQDENSATTEAGTGGAPSAPPSGTVIDSVNGVTNILRNGVAINAIIQKIGVKWMKEGARAQYGMGSAAAAGMGKGKLKVDGSLSTFFKDFTLYAEFKAETGSSISFRALDGNSKGYIITICRAKIMNPKITAGQPNADFMADFEIEGEPGDTTLYGGKTLQIDYFA